MSTSLPSTLGRMGRRRRRPLAAAAAVVAASAMAVTTTTLATVNAAHAGDPRPGTSSSRFVRLMQDFYSAPGGSRTEILDLPGLPTGAPKEIATSNDGRHVAVIGYDGVVYYADLSAPSPRFSAQPGRTGTGVMVAQHVDLDSQPSSSQPGMDFVQLVVVAGDGRMFHRTKPQVGDWSPWGEPTLIGGTYKDVSVSIDGYGNAHYAAISEYGEAVYRIRYPNRTWSNWELVPNNSGGKLLGSAVSIGAVTRTDLPNRCFEESTGGPKYSWSPNAAIILSTIDTAGETWESSKLLGRPFAFTRGYHSQPSDAQILETETVVANRGTDVVGRIHNRATDGKIYSLNSGDLISQNFLPCENPSFPSVTGPLVPLAAGSAGFAASATSNGYAYLTNE